jgi:hypothetical protein
MYRFVSEVSPKGNSGFSLVSQQEADLQAKVMDLNGCMNCVQCRECENCSDCFLCVNCVDCKNCIRCYDGNRFSGYGKKENS